jgi:AcrR family transcriptional regulator
VALVNATIELLREVPLPDVTVRKIAERANLNTMAITNIFGSQQELFVAVTRELLDRFSIAMASLPEEQLQFTLLTNEDLILRTRLVAWLILQGADPQLFIIERALNVSDVFMGRQQQDGATEGQSWLFTQLLQFLAEGFVIFREAHPHRPDDLVKAAAILQRIRQEFPKMAEDLGID